MLLLNTGSGTAVTFVSKFVENEQCGSPDLAGWTDQVIIELSAHAKAKNVKQKKKL